MAEFVEQRVDVVEADQLHFAFGCLGDVEHIVDHRLGAPQIALVDEVAHPRPAALGLALERVEIEQTQLAAVTVEHRVGRHIGVIDGQVAALLEGQAVELFGGIEHAVLEHGIELEIFRHRVFVEVVALRLDLVGIAVPVPRLDFEITPFGSDRFVEHGCFAALRIGERGDHAFHEAERGGGLFGHAVPHCVAGPVGFTEQRGFLGTQFGDPGDQRAGVDRGRAIGAVVACLEQLLARGAICHRRQQRLLRRVLQRDRIFARIALFGSKVGSRLDVRIGQPGEFGAGVEDDRLVGHCSTCLLAEFGRDLGQFGIDLLDPLALGLGQQRAGVDHALVGLFEQPGVFARHRHGGAVVVHRLHPREKFGVERDGIAMRGQLGTDFGVDLIEPVGGVRPRHGKEHARHPAEHAARLFQRDDGVAHRRRCGIVDDRLDLGLLDRHALFESG